MIKDLTHLLVHLDRLSLAASGALADLGATPSPTCDLEGPSMQQAYESEMHVFV